MRLDPYTVLRVLWRSLFIQAGFNPEGLQNLGLVFAIYPALQQLYPEGEALNAAVRRHLATFNTHPYVAAGIVGGILFHEERIARGEEPAEQVVQFKASLMGPLAALGDGFFWLSLRPAVGAFSVALVPVLDVWAAALFLVLFNTVHLYARGRFFLLGYRYGDGLVAHLSAAHLPLWGERLRSVAAACAGGLVAWLALAFGQHERGARAAALVGACLVVGALTFGLLRRAVSPWALWYAGAALAIAAGALL